MILLPDWFSYHVWGTDKQLAHLSGLPDEVYAQEMQSVFSSMQEVFEHVWVVDALWLKRMQGEESPSIAGKRLPSIETAREEFAVLHEEMMNYITSVENPETVRSFKTMKGIEMENSIEEMIYTVVNHGSYHRGNVTAMHRQLGYVGIPYDYIYYLKDKAKR
ncbi:DinB family protein [Jeotgalibacillus sp. S-D1]|uniref:DinB family protein n=1 Tax=Jeotgalibacillus sp. S-D1 TaxID=2552189 RepID=UPI001404D483|nr:DinB family protein [Jeotgalibacillus sp. S-D1]